MKKYKLLKDLPGIKAGEIFDGLPWMDVGLPVRDTMQSRRLALCDYPEWFQEIPDYSFVKDGDVYRQSDSGGGLELMVIEGTDFWWATAEEAHRNQRPHGTNKAALGRGRSPSVVKPENLVYRPGKNPWDTPEVDKLGWGPMEVQSLFKVVPTTDYRWIVREDLGRDRGDFKNKEDAELFKQALEGQQ